MSVNKVILVGRLGQDPELKQTSAGPVCRFSLATSESWTKDGQKQEKVEWHKVVVWNKLAEICAKYLGKGKQVYLEGKIQTQQWEDQEGKKRTTTEILAGTVQFLSSQDQVQENNAPQTEDSSTNFFKNEEFLSEEIPF